MRLRKVLALAFALMLMISAIPAFERVAKAGYDMPYYIKCDLTNQIVTIYSTETDVIVRQMLCSSGLKNATPHGTFYLPEKQEKQEREEWYFFRSYDCYAHYATRIFKGVLFHSIPYKLMDESPYTMFAIRKNKESRDLYEIPARQMYEFRMMCNPEIELREYLSEEEAKMKPGSPVLVKFGPLKGMTGRLVRKSKKYYLLKEIPGIGVMLKISRWCCVPLEE